MHHTNTLKTVLAIIAGIVLLNVTTTAAPEVTLSVRSVADKQQLTAEGVDLPELSAITFLCSYTLPHATLFASIVSSPLPSTTLSVLVDTTTSTFTITLTPTKPVTPAPNTTLLIIKSPPAAGTLTITKATLTGNSSSIDVPVSAVATKRKFRPRAEPHCRATLPAIASGYTLAGKRVSQTLQQPAHGCYLQHSPQQSTIQLQMR